MKIKAIIGVFLSVVSFSTFAADCFLIMCNPEGDRSHECVATPSKMSAAMPSGLAIKGIRGYTAVAPHDPNASYERACQRVPRLPEPVSLDQGSFYGMLRIAGTLRTKGILRYEPNDGGELTFLPEKQLFKSTGPFFRGNFDRLKLDEAKPTISIRAPGSLESSNCWTATATLSATDFDLIVGDSSAAGNYVRRATLSNVREFKQCKWGE